MDIVFHGKYRGDLQKEFFYRIALAHLSQSTYTWIYSLELNIYYNKYQFYVCHGLNRYRFKDI